ncbi:NAD(+) diphosphatase [Motilimonas pumila]|uniref:NAD-capped RNA hydrolase NudC n=1 Tax=Motilimonas pumila TaxID=2303987 RepID=A0A418YF41_9GAMM|nr:NAD(+) diphosphatase [Motilimonas pumila]
MEIVERRNLQNNQLVLNQTENSWWFILAGGKILVSHMSCAIPFGSLQELPFPDILPESVLPIGEYDASPCYLVDLGQEEQDMGMGEFRPLRYLLSRTDESLFNMAGRAVQIANFLDTHRFCGRCGNTMTHIDWELALKCYDCGHRCYPRISPCIIVAIRKDKRILLANHVRHNQPGNEIFTTLAGFVEAGETLEQCVQREVFEEAGIKVKNISYVKSQPWPFPHSLMMGFVADYDSGDIHIDPNELQAADWFSFDQLPLLPPEGTLARALIEKIRHRCR